MNTQRLYYPWISSLSVLMVALYLYLAANRSLTSNYTIFYDWFEWYWQLGAIALGLVATLIDIHLFGIRQKKFNQDMQLLKQQIHVLSETKKQLQRKAHTYSNQTEKLKSFIGDKLLEYIEYDEKFLHFKGIAAEVRHNGIISYDKILSALQAAEQSSEQNAIYSDALVSLGYLWDLLDLSTADNIALHINSHIGECEEYFYQIQLQHENPLAAMDAPPYTPTFFAHKAIMRAVLPLIPEANQGISEAEKVPHQKPFGQQFELDLDKHCELLGNENHLVLIIENLVKNALFYSASSLTEQTIDETHRTIRLSLSRDPQFAQITVYNRGPHIAESMADQIYQLGYTTRRPESTHGRGLGLYFVSQIVSGYEGKISHRNIVNQPESYSIRLELSGDGFEGSQIQTTLIETVVTENSFGCINKTSTCEPTTEVLPEMSWGFQRTLLSIEITARRNGITHNFSNLSKGESQTYVEPCDNLAPRWLLSMENRGDTSKISFKPLDITGVEFNVRIPLAHNQFDDNNEDIESQANEYIDAAKNKIKAMG